MMHSKIKIFKPVKAPDKVMMNIKKYNLPTAHLVLIGGTLEETCEFVQELIKPNLNPFREGTRTTVEFREFKDGKNGRTTSFSFYGHSTPEEIKDFFEKNIVSDQPGEVKDAEYIPDTKPGKKVSTTTRTRRSPGKSTKTVTTTPIDEDEDSPI